MKTLIIDNGSKWITQLCELIVDEKVIIGMKDISSVDTESFDLIVLSGSRNGPSVLTNDLLGEEFDLVKKSQIPIIGVCYGAEVIVYSYGGLLERMDGDHRGVTTLHLIEGKDVKVYEAHHFRIKKLPEDFIVLGRTEHAIEFFKHVHKPIYGLQFHPEAFVDSTEGKEILMGIISDIMKK